MGQTLFWKPAKLLLCELREFQKHVFVGHLVDLRIGDNSSRNYVTSGTRLLGSSYRLDLQSHLVLSKF